MSMHSTNRYCLINDKHGNSIDLELLSKDRKRTRSSVHSYIWIIFSLGVYVTSIDLVHCEWIVICWVWLMRIICVGGMMKELYPPQGKSTHQQSTLFELRFGWLVHTWRRNSLGRQVIRFHSLARTNWAVFLTPLAFQMRLTKLHTRWGETYLSNKHHMSQYDFEVPPLVYAIYHVRSSNGIKSMSFLEVEFSSSSQRLWPVNRPTQWMNLYSTNRMFLCLLDGYAFESIARRKWELATVQLAMCVLCVTKCFTNVLVTRQRYCLNDIPFDWRNSSITGVIHRQRYSWWSL